MSQLLLVAAGALAAVVLGYVLRRARPTPSTVAGAVAVPTDPLATVAEVVADHRCGVVVAGRSGRVRYRNAASRLYEGTHTGVIIDAAVQRHLDLARAGDPSGETVELYGPPRIVVDVRALPMPSGGAVAYVDDISEQRRVEQVRTDFVANISHELKTPIGALAVLAETLLDEDDPDTIQRVVDRMMSEAQRASRTVDDLMELSRIEAGGERDFERVPVDVIVRQAIGRVTELATRREISFVVPEPATEPTCRIEVLGDRRQLVSAIGNLVENAVKYSPTGSAVVIDVAVVDDAVAISVSDDGVGIPQRDLDRIFERFYRVDRARSRVTGGTGLGLSIVRHVANNHGGSVEVQSIEGEGSTFVFRLPSIDLADATEPADATTDTGSNGEGADDTVVDIELTEGAA